MPLLDLWTKDPEQLKGKQVQQLIAFAGAGRLLDDSPCSAEFRAFLERVSPESLSAYSDQCLTQSFQDSGLALQDIVNEIGSRLGARVTPGRYRGTSKHVGYDGLWVFESGHALIVEVKTTDAYRIALDTIAEYRLALVASQTVSEAKSSILLVVGRQDTGDLEAQIRGSRYAWDIRIISVEWLCQLMTIRVRVEDPASVRRIHDILVPRDFTRLDGIVKVLFSATEEIQVEGASQEEETTGPVGDEEVKIKQVAFHEACIQRVQSRLGVSLVRRSRSGYSSPDKRTAVHCLVSKEYTSDTQPNYWFSFYPHQQQFLRQSPKAYVAFGCDSSKRLILIPFADFEPWLAGASTTSKPEQTYWHIVIYRKGNKYTLHQKGGEKAIDLTSYVLPEEIS